MTRTATLYWNTIRHLRPVQVYGRAWFRLVRPRIDSSPAPARRPVRRGEWVTPAGRQASLVDEGRFCFLNETRDLVTHGWDDPSLDTLWRYNLHYFDDLNARNAPARAAWHLSLLSKWVHENPAGKGTGWEPFPTSLRMVNWIKWALCGNRLPSECVESLAVQARWLARRIEIHLLGNHLFANAKALVFAGLFFEGPEAQAWLEKGLHILEREIPEQILSDGGQFERSTMYHALALEDMLDLCNVTAVFADAMPERWRFVPGDWREKVGPMRSWLAAMCHPDGEIGLFNDATIGIAPAPAELDRYAEQLGFSPLTTQPDGVTRLAQSGYARVALGTMVALLDVAPVGPDYLPGHAHADTLSFELSVLGQRLLVNSGTSCYGLGTERERQRGTAAHSTVVIDGQDSSEVWGGFRVARRAKPLGPDVTQNGEVVVRCAHDGYRRLPGKPEHERRWMFGSNSLVVEDRVSGSFKMAAARFHIHPDVRSIASDGCVSGQLSLSLDARVTWRVEAGAPSMEPTTYHPQFGVSLPASCLSIRLVDGCSRIRFEWA